MLEVKGLVKKFDHFLAVDNISFKAQSGKITGFLGPNGAGKSTTMKMITGFLQPDNGDVNICGESITSNTLKAQKTIGYVPENAPLYEEMYVREFLEFICEAREVKDYSKRIDEIIDICSLQEAQNKRIENLSKGYKRRVSLAQALIYDPDVLILDEPTDGLDPNQKFEVRQLIKKLAEKKCILISTHILEEVEEICDTCLIISHGKKVFEGTPSELKAKSSHGKIQDVFRVLTTGENIEGVRV